MRGRGKLGEEEGGDESGEEKVRKIRGYRINGQGDGKRVRMKEVRKSKRGLGEEDKRGNERRKG